MTGIFYLSHGLFSGFHAGCGRNRKDANAMKTWNYLENQKKSRPYPGEVQQINEALGVENACIYPLSDVK